MCTESGRGGSLGRRWGQSRPHRVASAICVGDPRAWRECPLAPPYLAARSGPATPADPFNALIGGVVLSAQLVAMTRPLHPLRPVVPQSDALLKRRVPMPADTGASARLRRLPGLVHLLPAHESRHSR